MNSVRLDPQAPPRMNLEGQHAGVIKRIRQACRNCRYAICSISWSVRPIPTPNQLAPSTGHNLHGSHDD